MISYNLRIIQEYFQPKSGRKIRIFSLGWKNNILTKKECNDEAKKPFYEFSVIKNAGAALVRTITSLHLRTLGKGFSCIPSGVLVGVLVYVTHAAA